jgi:predicted nucleotidyltransferase
METQFFYPDFGIQKLCLVIGVAEEEILNCYLCGSRVYGTHNDESDWDFISVVEDGFFAKYPEKSNLIDDHFISSGLVERDKWEKMLIEVWRYRSISLVFMFVPFISLLLANEVDF